jgi:NTE family protein
MTSNGSAKKKVALVIGSGGIKCAAVIGVMKVLTENNIDVDIVVGCSGGSVFGAAIALGLSPTETNKIREQTWTSDITKKLDRKVLAKIFFPKRAGFDDIIGLFDDTIMTRNIEKAFGASTTFSETKIPFHCVATEFNTGEPVVLSEGSITKAIRASSGIPLVFKPVEMNGKLLIDGGLSNPLPVDVAIQEGADIIIAVGFEAPLSLSVGTVGNFAGQMFNIMVNQLLSTLLGYYNLAYHSEIVTIIPEFKESIKVNDVHKVPFIIEQGEKETLRNLNYIKQLLHTDSEILKENDHG